MLTINVKAPLYPSASRRLPERCWKWLIPGRFGEETHLRLFWQVIHVRISVSLLRWSR